MNAILDKLPALVKEELETANALHTVFHSMHEGYAVLREEVEEAAEELERVADHVATLWNCIRNDDSVNAQSFARRIEWAAVQMAAEAIQVAAMAQKFQAIEDGWTLKEKPEER